MLTVQKFGGSSLADAEKLRRAAETCLRERRRGRDVAVVVSAMGKTTDGLLALAREISPTPPERELDALVSTGECSSAALLAITLESMSQRAISLTGWQSGIFTDSRHGGAEIISLTGSRVRSALAHGVVPVISGFQGVDGMGDVTTLGRGGSDTTAVALAAALRAESCDIFTDVDGIYTADPRLVPTAHRLTCVDLRDMLTLSCAGAQVLCPRSVSLALERAVDIRLAPASGEGEGTRVCLLEPEERADFAGLALRGGEITLAGPRAQESAAQLAGRLTQNGIRPTALRLADGAAVFDMQPDVAIAAMRALHSYVFE